MGVALTGKLGRNEVKKSRWMDGELFINSGSEVQNCSKLYFASPWEVLVRKQAWDHPHRGHRHIRAPLDSPIRFATPSTLPLSNVNFYLCFIIGNR